MSRAPYIPRQLDIARVAASRSVFLFGPRQTGKTSLIRETLPDAPLYDLLDNSTFLQLSQHPGRLAEELTPESQVVVIDEIQKLPGLLDEVHRLIEARGTRFVLTGSSARKLRRGGVNLLGGRARTRTLHPFVYAELGNRFDLNRALSFGLIPPIYFSDAPEEDLASYAGTYVREEVAAEALTRNVPAFSRFLEVAALCSGKMINYTQVASDAQVPQSTVREYFDILEDTLLGSRLLPWKKSLKRKPIVTAKFFLCDVGLARHLQHRTRLKPRSPEFGEAFEHYLYHELRAYLAYRAKGELRYWRSKSRFEVDFILNDAVAIEAKAKATVGERDLKGLKALREEELLEHYIAVTLEQRPRTVDGIRLLPWREFLERLWADALPGC